MRRSPRELAMESSRSSCRTEPARHPVPAWRATISVTGPGIQAMQAAPTAFSRPARVRWTAARMGVMPAEQAVLLRCPRRHRRRSGHACPPSPSKRSSNVALGGREAWCRVVALGIGAGSWGVRLAREPRRRPKKPVGGPAYLHEAFRCQHPLRDLGASEAVFAGSPARRRSRVPRGLLRHPPGPSSPRRPRASTSAPARRLGLDFVTSAATTSCSR